MCVFSTAPACIWMQIGRRDHSHVQHMASVFAVICGSSELEPRTLCSLDGRSMPLSIEPHLPPSSSPMIVHHDNCRPLLGMIRYNDYPCHRFFFFTCHPHVISSSNMIISSALIIIADSNHCRFHL